MWKAGLVWLKLREIPTSIEAGINAPLPPRPAGAVDAYTLGPRPTCSFKQHCSSHACGGLPGATPGRPSRVAACQAPLPSSSQDDATRAPPPRSRSREEDSPCRCLASGRGLRPFLAARGASAPTPQPCRSSAGQPSRVAHPTTPLCRGSVLPRAHALLVPSMQKSITSQPCWRPWGKGIPPTARATAWPGMSGRARPTRSSP